MHALTFPQLFDLGFPAVEKVRQCPRPVRPRQIATLPQPCAEEGLLSIPKLYDRLSLLAKLELPCTINITRPALLLRHAVIEKVHMADESLTITGRDFNLRLLGPNIHSIRLSSQPEAGSKISRLDIHHSHGMLYASIQPAPDGSGNEVWQDVMDNPSLPLS